MQCSLDRTLDGVLHVVLRPNLSLANLQVAIDGLATIPRRHASHSVHLSQPLTAFSLDLWTALIPALARVLAHCPHIDWDLSGGKIPPLEFLVSLYVQSLDHRHGSPSRLSVAVGGDKLLGADVLALERLRPLLHGLRVRHYKHVSPSLLGVVGRLDQLVHLDLSRFFTVRHPLLFDAFLTLLAPFRACSLPRLTHLSLHDNAFSKADVTALASTLRYHPTLQHLSLAFAMPTMDIDMGRWLAFALLQSPHNATLTSLNLSGLPFQHDVLDAMAHFQLASFVASTTTDIEAATAMRQCSITSSIATGLHHITHPTDGHRTIAEVVAWQQTLACVVLPRQGFVWLDQQLVHGAIDAPAPPRRLGLCELIFDDLKPAGLLLPLLDMLPTRDRLDRLRLRRYGLTGPELHELLVRCPGLLELDLKACQLTDISSLVQMWREASHPLQRLHLAKNLIGATGAVHLAGALSWSHLTDLDISKNLIGDIGITALHEALQDNQTLVRLTVDTAAASGAEKAFLDHHVDEPLYVTRLPVDVKYLFVGMLHQKHKCMAVDTQQSLWHQVLDPSLIARIFEFAATLVTRRVRVVA
ncbi:Aste57867_18324 [Aphanomyces stellatus]|uniref:Aste57867_18324 protein n=1 Tax=Aphanomyces stellatus TaxID=120398 RepID=A0A485L9T2_9STRA|nr:hypothetical protein As57867_018262 [Aphanomyces stellatus]KAF0711094.1 hypothetical protein As57867_005380 [Aphanomyces stellatus]VFT82451.1 Aste57867_5393 [Aphanomyces stellatus]VFT95060.1 Aste57867_18324 [Aphanomyces stellatus]